MTLNRSTRMALAALATLVAALAGCATPAVETTSSSSTTLTTSPPTPQGLVLTDCKELHTFYDAPRSGFEPLVPEGFTLQDGSVPGATAKVVVFGFFCAGDRVEIWSGVFVTPPAAAANSSLAVDALLLRGFANNATDAAQYHAWGLAPFHRATSRSTDFNDAGAGDRDGITLAGDGISYSVTTTVSDQPGPFSAAAYRFWVANGTRATGYALLVHDGGISVGAGTAEYSQEGDPAAPPATYGVGHRADVTAATHRFQAYA